MNHLQAARIVESVLTRVLGRTPTPTERAMMQAVAWLESHYGRASGQHAKWAAQGLYTWGNIEKHRDPNLDPNVACDATQGWYPGTDAGNPRCFLLDKTDEKAAERYIKTMISAGDINSSNARTRAFGERSLNIRKALATGDPVKLANAMKTPASVAYYEAPAAQYAAGLKNALFSIDKDVPRVIVNAGKPLPSPASPALSGEESPSESGASSLDVLDRSALNLTLYLLSNGNKASSTLRGLTLAFQAAHGGLKPDGIFGPLTCNALGTHVRYKFGKGDGQ